MSIDYAARVAKGVALLDERMPGWADRIDLETLDIASGTLCVAAQLSGVGSYFVGMRQLGLGAGEVGHGFIAEHHCRDCYPDLPADYSVDAAYATLTELWREVIASRRTAKAEAPAPTA